MPAGRCASCGFLCNPDLFGCPDPTRPCPRKQICYCSQLCQDRDAHKHRDRFHSDGGVQDQADVCVHFLRAGYCPYDRSCRKRHQLPVAATVPTVAPPAPVLPPSFPPAALSEVPIFPVLSDLVEVRMSPEGAADQQFIAGNVDQGADVQGPCDISADVEVVHEDVETLKQDPASPQAPSCPELHFCPSETVPTIPPPTSPPPAPSPSPTDGGPAPSLTKKSRLEMRREARKAKKAMRKREKMALVGKQGTTTVAESGNPGEVEEEQEEPVAEEEDEVIVTVPADYDEAAEDRILTPPLKESREDSVGDKGTEEVSQSRQMTKKQKKREERRLLNAQKKIKRLKLKEAEKAEEKTKRKEAAQDLMTEGKFLEAAIALTKLMADATDDDKEMQGELFSLRSECHLALGKAKRALEDAEQAVALTQPSPQLPDLIRLTKMYRLTGKTDRARQTAAEVRDDSIVDEIRYLDAIDKGFSESVELLTKEDWVKGLESLSNTEKLCPHSPRLAFLKAEAQIHLHIYPSGKATLDRYHLELREDPHFVYVQNLLAYYTTPWWEEEKKEPRVVEVFRLSSEDSLVQLRCIKMHSKAVAAKASYKKALLALKSDENPVSVRQAIKACMTIDPNNLSFLAEAHCLLAKAGDSDDERLRHFSTSLKMKETYGAYLGRGNVYRSKRKYQEALSDYENASRLDPASEDARRLSEQMRRHISSGNQRDLRRRRGGISARSDFYSLLRVPFSATTEEIHKAYHQRLREVKEGQESSSPSAPGPSSTQMDVDMRIKALNKAFRVLKDPRQREMYDRQRKRSTSSDVDSEFSEEDYEAYESEDDDADGACSSSHAALKKAPSGSTQDDGGDDEELRTLIDMFVKNAKTMPANQMARMMADSFKSQQQQQLASAASAAIAGRARSDERELYMTGSIAGSARLSASSSSLLSPALTRDRGTTAALKSDTEPKSSQ